MFATLTGGVFLTGFALYMGMDEFMIGLLASMPFLVAVIQLPTSLLMEKTGRRKGAWYWGALFTRVTWIPILIVALLPISSTSGKYAAVLGLIFFSYCANSVSSVSWLSLMSDLVPDKIRGSFFGTRNMLCGAAGMAAMLVFGEALDFMEAHVHGGLSLGFGVVFVAAVFFGVVSLRFLNRVSEPKLAQIEAHRSFGKGLMLPFKESNFKKFLIFVFLWSFSVFFAAPFFTLYFLQDLKFSYGFIAALATIAGTADLTGMRLWGKISDNVRNKAIIRLSSWVAILIPLAWVFVRPGSIVLPIIFNLIGGGFWAGINLCMNNLLLEISPKENRAIFLSMYNIVGGLGAAAGPIIAGLLLISMNGHVNLWRWEALPIQIIFLISTVLRLLSYQLFKYVHEPEEVEPGQVVRILWSVRGLNVATGFSYLLHPFVEIARNNRKGAHNGSLGKIEEPVSSHDLRRECGSVRL
jgi:MFS family permease